MDADIDERRYRDKECALCSQILPANQMRTVRVNRRSGHTQGGSRRFSNRSSSSTVNYGSRYRMVSFVVCPECPDPKSEGGFSKFVIRGIIGLGVGGAVLASIFGGLGSVVKTPIQTTDQSSAPDISSLTADDQYQNLPNTDTSSAQPTENAFAENNIFANKDYAEPTQSATYDTVVLAPSVFEVHTEALNDATSKALISGRTEKWSDAGATGYVTPSELNGQVGTACRNVFAVVIVNGVSTRSNIEKICQYDGNWYGNAAFQPG